MSVIIRYTKQHYLGQIDELEGYKQLLDTHLTKMCGYRDQISSFWDDSNAQTAYRVLNALISQVEFTMNQTQEMIIFYRNAVNELDATNIISSDLLEKALSLLSSGGGAAGGGSGGAG